MALKEAGLRDSSISQTPFGTSQARTVYASEKGSANTYVDAPPVRRAGGSGGNSMDDVLKRLGSLESSATEIKAHVSGLTATVQHLATKADLNILRADVHSLEASLIKWIIGTVLASAGLAFAIAKFVI